jgi:hypothetical protein
MHAPHVDVGLRSKQTAHSPAPNTLDFLWLELTNPAICGAFIATPSLIHKAAIATFLRRSYYDRLMREAYDLGCRKLQFIGGEPQLNRDFQKLLVRANTIGFEFIEVFSNSRSSRKKRSVMRPTTGFASRHRSIPTSPKGMTPSPE